MTPDPLSEHIRGEVGGLSLDSAPNILDRDPIRSDLGISSMLLDPNLVIITPEGDVLTLDGTDLLQDVDDHAVQICQSTDESPADIIVMATDDNPANTIVMATNEDPRCLEGNNGTNDQFHETGVLGSGLLIAEIRPFSEPRGELMWWVSARA